jgi:putative peptide zinc metalloprotease protein
MPHMQETLLSPHWYRISGLHPRLRPHVQARMHVTRGRAWYVLHNLATGRFHRVNAQAYELVGRLDGRFTVDQIWQRLLDQLGDMAPSQHDVIRILGQLTDAGVVQAEVTPDVRQMMATGAQRASQARRKRLNPLSFRVSLFNPSALLIRLQPLAQLLCQPWLMWCWLLAVGVASVLAALNMKDIAPYAHQHFMSPGFLAMTWAVYPIMKGLHELAHALALRRHGCEVPELGVSFFLFVPLPYVDASAANRLIRRWPRVQISAAGVAVEMLLASLALGLWLAVEDGWLRQLCFVIMATGSLSTLMFNGNPLMKFDGYFVLCDLLELPNLAQRSSQALMQASLRLATRMLGMAPSAAPASALAHTHDDPLEAWALRLYAPLSWVYRLSVSALMITWASERSALLGLAIGLWCAWSQLLVPLKAWLDQLTALPGFAQVQGRALGGATLAITSLLALAALVPVPSSVVLEGVVWLPEHAQIRATGDGEVDEVAMRSGQRVQAGQTVMRLSSPELLTRQAVLNTQIASLENELNGAFATGALRAKNAQDALSRDRAALAQIEQELARQALQAGVAGEFVVSHQEDLPQRLVKRGELLAYVLADEPSVVRALVPQRMVDAVRHRLRGISVVLDEQPGTIRPARLISQVPAAIDQLPSPALSDRSGGRVSTLGHNPDELRPSEPQFVIDVALPDRIPRAGGLARVRIELAAQPLFSSLAHSARQLFLKHFSDVRA